MSRISAIEKEQATPEQLALYNKIVAEHGVVTNMKATLLHSREALDAVLQWYALFAKVKPVIGERRAILFCDAISRQNQCTLCATFMRRAIVKGGENPEQLQLDAQDKALIEYGRNLAKDPNRIRDSVIEELKKYWSEAEIVDLTVFGALMIVNNVFNSALQVDVDSSLDGFVVSPDVAFSPAWFEQSKEL